MNSECNRARPVYRRVHRGERQCRKGLRVHRTKEALMRYPPLRHEKQPPSQGRRLTMNGKKTADAPQWRRDIVRKVECYTGNFAPRTPRSQGRPGAFIMSGIREAKRDMDRPIHAPFRIVAAPTAIWRNPPAAAARPPGS